MTEQTRASRHAVLVFVDGVGIGPPDPNVNPFFAHRLPTLEALIDGEWLANTEVDAFGLVREGPRVRLFAADARLETAGRPQSGTGTTSLLTGINAAAALGRHAGPYPPADIRPILERKNIFARVQQAGGTAAFANAFPPFYFDRLARGRARRTTMTQAALAADVRLRGVTDLQRGEALSAFITLDRWRQAAPELPHVTAHEAGVNLADITRRHNFTSFEYFRTDHIGHRPDMDEARRILADVDDLLAGLVAGLDPERDLLVVASDHGNCEDLGSSQHTLNPVPVLVWGAVTPITTSVTAITDLVPMVLDWLQIHDTVVEAERPT